MHKQITFCDLRCKDVINVTDGRFLGNIVDLALDCASGCVLGLILPGECRFFSLFKGEQIFIPWSNICKIGEDVILVELCDFEGVRGCAVGEITSGKSPNPNFYTSPNPFIKGGFGPNAGFNPYEQ